VSLDPEAVQRLAESSVDFEFLLDPAGRYIYASPSCKTLTGREPAEFVADPELRYRVVHPEDRYVLRRHRLDDEEQHKAGLVDFRVIRSDGTERWVEHSCRPVYDSEGTFIGTRGSNRDITDRKQAEERSSERAALIELAHEAIIVLDLEDRVILWNRGAEEVYGWTREQATGRVAHELLRTVFPKSLSVIKEDLLRDWQWDGELRQTRSDGEAIVVASRWAMRRNSEGGPLGILEINRDITARKEAQDRVVMMNALLRQYVEKASRQEYLDAVVEIVREWTGCRCVALRIMNAEGRLPFQSHIGFSQQFLDAENQRSTEEHQCTCVRVVTGRLEDRDAPGMTAGGSFFTSDNTQSVDGTAPDPRVRSCGLCMQAGFASIAVIPIRCGEQTLGAFHLADERPGHVSPKTVEFVESFASMVGDGVRRFDSIEGLRQHRDQLAERVEAATAALRASEERYEALVDVGQQAAGRQRIEGLEYSGMVSRHPQMLQCLAIVRRVASARVPVLIRGESGTGKELIARALHRSGNRREKPFVVVNCAAVPETLLEAELFGIQKGVATGVVERAGRFETANGGTVFLDEVGDMEPGLQAKLLRFLEDEVVERVGGGRPLKVDVRIVAATNQNLEQRIASGAFRRDLLYRLNTVELLLPRLAGRVADIRDFVFYFITRSNKQSGRNIKGISLQAMHQLMNYSWPGNVRQLEHVIARAVLMAGSDIVELSDLPMELQQAEPSDVEAQPGNIRLARAALQQKVESEVEKQMVLDCLETTSWCVTKAAKIAGYSRFHLHRLMRKYGITRPAKVLPEPENSSTQQ